MARAPATVVSAAVAAVALAAERAYADGPFRFPPFSSSSSSSSPPVAPPSPVAPETGRAPEEAAPEKPRARNDNPRTTAAGFDPEPLERGVAALNEINKSPNAKKVFELMKKQEETRQVELAAKKAEYQVMQAQYEAIRSRS